MRFPNREPLWSPNRNRPPIGQSGLAIWKSGDPIDQSLVLANQVEQIVLPERLHDIRSLQFTRRWFIGFLSQNNQFPLHKHTSLYECHSRWYAYVKVVLYPIYHILNYEYPERRRLQKRTGPAKIDEMIYYCCELWHQPTWKYGFVRREFDWMLLVSQVCTPRC
jgi:hypothetical protein